MDEIFSKPLKKDYITNKTEVYHIDDNWSLDILDLKNYDPANDRRYRYILVAIDTFSKFGWTTPSKKCSTEKRLFCK